MTETIEKTSEIVLTRNMTNRFFEVCKRYNVADYSITVQPNFDLLLFGYVNGNILDGTSISAQRRDFEVAITAFAWNCRDAKTLKAEKIKQLREKIKMLEGRD